MITIDIREKNFGPKTILRDVSFTLGRGERAALLGPSGIGKSTVLRILSGLDRDFEGQVDGPAKIAMVFQEPTLLAWRSARDNLCLATDVSPEQASEALSAVGLAEHGDHYPAQMSLGQMRRVSLARALCADPDLLVLDEPFASLDEATAEEMMDLVQSCTAPKGIALLLVTHSAREARQLTDRVLTLGGEPATLV